MCLLPHLSTIIGAVFLVLAAFHLVASLRLRRSGEAIAASARLKVSGAFALAGLALVILQAVL